MSLQDPHPALAASLHKFGVIETKTPTFSRTSPNTGTHASQTKQLLQALIAINPKTTPIQFIPELTPERPENGAIHTAAQKTLHYTVNALLYNLETKLNHQPDNQNKTATAIPFTQQPSTAATPEEETALYWLANQMIQKSITQTNYPIFTYRHSTGEIRRQKHYNQLNSTLHRLNGLITASRLYIESNATNPPSAGTQEIAEAINALRFPPLQQLAQDEEKQWLELEKTERYNEIFLEVNPQTAIPDIFDPNNQTLPTREPEYPQPKEKDGFQRDEIVQYHTAKREQRPNPNVNNAQAWTLTEFSPETPHLEQTKTYILDKIPALLQKAEQTPGIGFQLPEVRWSGNRHYALPHALRRMYQALESANHDLSEIDPSPQVLQALQQEQFSFAIFKACELTGVPYPVFKEAWEKELRENPGRIQGSTRTETILKTLTQASPQASTAQKLQFLEQVAVTGGYAIEISPRQNHYREQISDILAKTISEIQLQEFAALPTDQTAPQVLEKGTAVERLLRTPLSGILRREITANVRILLKDQLQTDPKLTHAVSEIRKTSADLRNGTYIPQHKADALNYILGQLAQSPEPLQTSPPVLVPRGAQFARNLEYLINHLPEFKHLKEEELTGAALTYLNAKQKPEKEYCLRLAEQGNLDLTRKILNETNQAIFYLQKEETLPAALAEARHQLAILTTPAYLLAIDERETNRNYFAGLFRALTLWRKKPEQQQYPILHKGYTTLNYAANLSQNRFNNEFFPQKEPFTPQMQTDLLVFGLNILHAWKNDPDPHHNPKRHLPTLHNLSAKFRKTLEIDPLQAQADALNELNLSEIVAERTERALFNFLRAQNGAIAKDLLTLRAVTAETQTSELTAIHQRLNPTNSSNRQKPTTKTKTLSTKSTTLYTQTL